MQIRLKAISIILILFSLPYYGRAQATDSLLTQLSRKWVNAKTYTLKIADLMPAEFYDFKPTPEEMSFKEQLLHTAQNMQSLSASYLLAAKNPPVPKEAKDKAAIRQILASSYDIALAPHRNLSAKQLDDTVPFFAGPLTRRQILLLLHDHQTHHVGQLIVYLRLKGIKPPAYVGW
jgi:uncharacterized damage-inducible protein DinB